jgi:ABC-type Na+ efflux pump permease subunit
MWLRRNLLRLLAPVCASWAVLTLFAGALFDWIPGARRESTEAGVIAGVGLVCALSTWGACRRWPDFLSLPPAVPVGFLVVRTIVYVAILLVVIAALFGAIEYVNLRLTGDPDNPQYGVSVVFAAVWYPAALTPILTLVAVWRAAKRRADA